MIYKKRKLMSLPSTSPMSKKSLAHIRRGLTNLWHLKSASNSSTAADMDLHHTSVSKLVGAWSLWGQLCPVLWKWAAGASLQITLSPSWVPCLSYRHHCHILLKNFCWNFFWPCIADTCVPAHTYLKALTAVSNSDEICGYSGCLV